jgi:hypothetical protein
LVVFQVQLARRIDVLPLTRNYMYTDEHRLLERDRVIQRPLMAGE